VLYVPTADENTSTGTLHVITLSVTDADGNVGQDTLLVRLHLLI
jgi:hypothetical protein